MGFEIILRVRANWRCAVTGFMINCVAFWDGYISTYLGGSDTSNIFPFYLVKTVRLNPWITRSHLKLLFAPAT
jgi:hypothetical protein